MSGHTDPTRLDRDVPSLEYLDIDPDAGVDSTARSRVDTPLTPHRLAPSEIGSGGSSRSSAEAFDDPDIEVLLERAADLLAQRPHAVVDTADAEHAAREARERTEEAEHLIRTAWRLRVARERSEMMQRRLRRVRASIDRRTDREQRRAQGGLYTGQGRTPTRPARAEVHPDAWSTVKRDAIEANRALFSVVGDIVRSSVEDCREPDHRQRYTWTGSPRFVRLVVEDSVWRRFRQRAVVHNLSSARYLGMLVEDEARRLGWRPPRRAR